MPKEFTEMAQKAFQEAFELALSKKNVNITENHLLFAFLKEETNPFTSLLKTLGIQTEELKKNAEKKAIASPVFGAEQEHPKLSTNLQKLVQVAEKLSVDWKDTYVSSEHFLVAFCKHPQEPFSSYLQKASITYELIEQKVIELRNNQPANSPNAESSYQALEKYCKNLTEFAKKGKLDPVIGRDEEIRRTIQVLSRRTKNNPLLIGEPGVGKTAIAEGLALRMVQKDVPETLQNKTLLALDMGALIAGTKFSRRVRRETEKHLRSNGKSRRKDYPFYRRSAYFSRRWSH